MDTEGTYSSGSLLALGIDLEGIFLSIERQQVIETPWCNGEELALLEFTGPRPQGCAFSQWTDSSNAPFTKVLVTAPWGLNAFNITIFAQFYCSQRKMIINR